MDWVMLKEVITVILSIIGGIGVIVVPLGVAIINSRAKEPKDKKKEESTSPAAVSVGMPVNIDEQMKQNVLMRILEDLADSKNDLERQLMGSEHQRLIEAEKRRAAEEELAKYKNKYSDL